MFHEFRALGFLSSVRQGGLSCSLPEEARRQVKPLGVADIFSEEVVRSNSTINMALRFDPRKSFLPPARNPDSPLDAILPSARGLGRGTSTQARPRDLGDLNTALSRRTAQHPKEHWPTIPPPSTRELPETYPKLPSGVAQPCSDPEAVLRPTLLFLSSYIQAPYDLFRRSSEHSRHHAKRSTPRVLQSSDRKRT